MFSTHKEISFEGEGTEGMTVLFQKGTPPQLGNTSGYFSPEPSDMAGCNEKDEVFGCIPGVKYHQLTSGHICASLDPLKTGSCTHNIASNTLNGIPYLEGGPVSLTEFRMFKKDCQENKVGDSVENREMMRLILVHMMNCYPALGVTGSGRPGEEGIGGGMAVHTDYASIRRELSDGHCDRAGDELVAVLPFPEWYPYDEDTLGKLPEGKIAEKGDPCGYILMPRITDIAIGDGLGAAYYKRLGLSDAEIVKKLIKRELAVYVQSRLRFVCVDRNTATGVSLFTTSRIMS